MKFELNLDVGKTVSYVKGGELDKEVIHVADIDTPYRPEETSESKILAEEFMKKVKRALSGSELAQLMTSLEKRQKPEDPSLGRYYDQILLLLNGSKGSEVELTDGTMHLTFDPKVERQVHYITGQSGSGKSTITGELVKNYHKIFPKNDIFLFSNKPSDPALDCFKYITRVPFVEELIEDPIDLAMIKNSLVIFDDVEGTTDKKIEKELVRISELILNQGRASRVSFIYISHLANDYKRTRTILNEMNSITVFPQFCSAYSLKYLLEKYLGFGKEDIKKLTNLPSRSVTILKAPTTVVHEKGVYLLR